MGDVRFAKYFHQVREAADPRAELARLDDDGLVAALAATAREPDAYVANVIATELLNRNRQSRAITDALGEGVFAIDLQGRLTFLNAAAERMLGWRLEEVLGQRFEMLLGPSPRGRAPSIAEALATPTESRFETWLRRSDATLLPALVTTAPIVRMDEPIGAVTVFRDQTEERRAEVERAKLLAREREARTRAEEAEQRSRFLARATQVLTEPLESPARLDRLAQLAVPMLGDWCSVHLQDDEGRLRLRAVAHADAELRELGRAYSDRYPLAPESPLLQVLRTGEPITLDDLDPEETAATARDETQAEMLRRLDLRTLLVLPLRVRDRIAGTLTIATSGKPRRYPPEERQLALDFARIAGVAIEHARTYESEQSMRRHAETAVRALNDALREARRTRQRYESLVTASSQLVWSADARGRLLDENPSWRALTGQSHEDARGHGWMERLHPEDRARVQRQWEGAGDRNEPYRTELRIRTCQDEYRTFVCFAVPVLGNAERVQEWVGACVDVTEQRRAEEALRESEHKWHALFENAHDGMLLVDGDGRVVDANAAVAGIVQRPREQMVGELVWTLAPPPEREPIQRMWRSLGGARNAQSQARFTRPDGSTREVELSATADVLKGRHLLVLHDVPPQRLRERRAAGFLESITDAFFALDREWRFTYVNEQAERLLRRPREQLLGRNVWEAFPEAVGSQFEREYKAALRHKRAAHFEAAYPPLGMWFEVNAYPSQEGLSVHFRDVSARRRADEDGARERADLEARVHERTRELEAANAELEAFTHSVSHDLRAPLRGIDFYAQVLEEDHGDHLDEEGRDVLQRLRAESRRTTNLVQDLLRLSRASREPIRRQDVDVSALAREVVDELRRAEPAREVRAEIQAGLHAHADPALLRVVLENLVGNAWKFTRERNNGARIDVGRDEDGAFFVRDNGAGFDPARADQLFTPFQRLHTVQQFEGTGLGLATVARIVERHGGSVRAQGRPGNGATLHFTLPDSRANKQESKKASDPPAG